MSSFRVSVIKIDGHPDGVTASTETEIFRQTFENLDLPKIVQALNKAPRARKPKASKS